MNPIRFFSLALSCATLLAVPDSSGQTARSVLDSLIGIAHDHNPGYRALRTRAEALNMRPDQIPTFADPGIEFLWQALPLETASGPVRSQWLVQQPLPHFGAPALRREAMQSQAAAADASALARILAQDLAIKVAYIDLHRVSQLEGLLDVYADRLVGFVDAARAQYAVAGGTQASLMRIQLEKNTLQAERLQLDAARDVQVAELAQLLGAELGDLPVLSDWPLPAALTLDDAELFEIAVGRRPELRRFASELQESNLNADLARKDNWPQFTAGVTWMDIQSTDAGKSGTDAVGVRVSATIPLSRRRTAARIQEAALVEEEIAARKEAFLQSLASRLSALRVQFVELVATLELYDDGLIPQADVMLSTTLSAYAAGQASFLDLLEAERMRYGLAEQRIGLAARLLRTAAELERTLGIDSLDDLQIDS